MGRKKELFTPADVEEGEDYVLPYFAQVIRDSRIKAGVSQIKIAATLKLSNNTVSAWERGASRPDLSLVPQLCELLGISLETFFGIPETTQMIPEEKLLLTSYRNLSKATKVTVQKIIDALNAQEDLTRHKDMKDLYHLCREVDMALSAGFGTPEDEEPITRPLFVRECKEAILSDLVFPINGNSMAPDFPNHSRVYVRTDIKPEYGEVGVFVSDGVPFIKIYEKDGLYSINPKYPPMLQYEDDNVICIGKVIGIVNPLSIAPKQDLPILNNLFEEEMKKMGFESINQ